MPRPLESPLRRQLGKVKVLHEQDLVEGFGEVYLPYALARKYPAAAREWAWQYVSPSAKLSVDPRSGVTRRHHASADTRATVAPDPKTGAVLLAKDLPILHRAALAACDASDGLKHGIISDPPACRFDPATVQCRAAGQADCLTRESVAAAKALYAGARGSSGRVTSRSAGSTAAPSLAGPSVDGRPVAGNTEQPRVRPRKIFLEKK